ncbi:hypothetical protein [Succinivibrio dextrinosolvens]|uniref:hypothetical protein n=1 Tax=Succinivibrio dextrinosolvens TaxID=83771 RepID=UPI001920A523|nr:hypothetical protein [Succinivibrio dextrinosolvens]
MNNLNILFTIFKIYLFRLKVFFFKLKYHINTYNHAIVLCDSIDEVNYYSYIHLKEYYDFFGVDSLKVFTDSDFILNNHKELLSDSSFIKTVSYIDKSRKDFFIKCARFGVSNIQLPSLTEPKDKSLDRLVNKAGLTIEDLVCLVEYRLFEYEKKEMSEKIKNLIYNK